VAGCCALFVQAPAFAHCRATAFSAELLLLPLCDAEVAAGRISFEPLFVQLRHAGKLREVT